MLSAPAAASCPPSGLNATASIFCWLWPTSVWTVAPVAASQTRTELSMLDVAIRSSGREDDVVDRGFVADEQVQLTPRRRLPDVSVPAAGRRQVLPVGRERGIGRLTRLRRARDEVARRDRVHTDHGIARLHGRREEPARADRDGLNRVRPGDRVQQPPVAVSQILRLFAASPVSTSRPPSAKTTSSTLAAAGQRLHQPPGRDVVEDDAAVARARGEQPARRGRRGRHGLRAERERRDRRAERVGLEHRVVARPEDRRRFPLAARSRRGRRRG